MNAPETKSLSFSLVLSLCYWIGRSGWSNRSHPVASSAAIALAAAAAVVCKTRTSTGSATGAQTRIRERGRKETGKKWCTVCTQDAESRAIFHRRVHTHTESERRERTKRGGSEQETAEMLAQHTPI